MAISQAPAPVADEQRRLPFPLSPQEGWGTVILAAVMVLVTVGCVQNLNWTANSSILTSTTFVGMLLGFFLAKQRLLPQWLADIPALLFGVIFAFWQTAMADTGGHLGVLWSHLSAWIASSRAGQASTDDVIFLLFLAILTMLLGYVSMWLIFRSRSPWLATAANAVVLLINLNYTTDDKIIYAVLFILAALLLIIRFNFVERLRLWKRKGLRYPPELGWDVMQAGIIFIIVVMVIGATLPTHFLNTNIQNLWNSPNSPWTGVQNGFSRLFHVNAGTSTRVAFGKNLRIVGNVSLPDTVVLTYTTTDTVGSYLQALTFDTFDNHEWGLTESADAKVLPLPANDTYGAETSAVKAITTNIRIVNAPVGDKNYLFGLGEPSSYARDAILHSDGLPLTANDTIGSYTEWLAKNAVQNGDVYAQQGLVSTATADQLRAVPMPSQAKANVYPTALLDRYTNLTKELASHKSLPYQQAMATTADATTMYDKVMAIIAYFSSFHYSQTNPDVPNDTDAVTFFLERQQGYCTWFATGLAVMLRELGIPSRVVEGFAGGSNFDPKTQQFVTRGTDSHMWTQVYFPKYGWINFEASVGFAPIIRPVSSTQPSGTTPQDPPLRQTKPKPITAPNPGSTTTPLPVAVPGAGKGNGVVGAVTISLSTLIAFVLLVLLAIGVWWRLLFRRLSPISQIFGRMTLLGRFAGVPTAPAQTASEYGATLAARFPDQQPEIEAITELYVRERWSPDAPEPATLAERWQRVRATLVRRIGESIPARLRRRR